ncbi:MAG: TRAP transporter small permease [Desulfatiglandaceae bacterium]
MKVSTVFDRTIDVLFVVSGVMLAFASLSVGAMVFSRYFLNRPLGWIIEINEYILLHIAFLTPAWVLRKEAHVKMDILFDVLGPKLQMILNLFSSLLGAAVCLVLTWFGVEVTLHLYQAKTITPTYLQIPKYPLTCVIFFGSFLFMIQYLRRANGFLKAFRELRNPEHLPEERLEGDTVELVPKDRANIEETIRP